MKPPIERLFGKTVGMAARRRRWKNWAIVAGYIGPAIATLVFILSYAVDIPYMDSFVLFETFDAIDSGEGVWQALWTPHNEHRILIPRVMFVVLAFLTGWNTYAELILSWLFAVLSFGLLCRLSWRQISWRTQRRSTIHHWPNIVTSVLFFSLAQYENWLWGFQVAWFWIVLCLLAAIAFVTRRPQPDRLDRNFWFAALFCGLASFSSAHGLLTWFAIAPCVLFAGARLRSALLPFGLWCGLGAIAIALYFYGYQTPNDTIDRGYAFAHPLAGLHYFISLIGGGITPDNLYHSSIFGVVVLATFTVCGLWFLRDRAVRPHLSPWLALGSFTIGFSAITAIGRASLSIHSAMASRYVTISVLIAIALVQIGAFVCGGSRRRQRWYRRACVAIVALSISSSIAVLPTADGLQQARQDGALCLTLRHYMQARPNPCLAQLFPDPWAAKIYYGQLLDRLDWHEFADEGEIAFVEAPSATYGRIETRKGSSIVVREGDRVSIDGWAIFPDRQRAPDLVFLAKDDRHKFFVEARVDRRSPDLVAHFQVNGYAYARWQVDFPAETLTKRKTLLRAWTYDPERRQFIRLQNAIEVYRPDISDLDLPGNAKSQ